jgi:acyl transferase domain-containing protein
VLLKRLDDALEAGDPIHAIIRNSACNHGGRSDGITMPRRSAQEHLLRRVHREVGLNPSETPVVEVMALFTPFPLLLRRILTPKQGPRNGHKSWVS